jgi:hypothetical protein
MSDISILDKTFIDAILATARRNLEHDGCLWPVLFVRFDEGSPVGFVVDLPATAEGRRAYLAAMGWSMRREGKVVREALLVIEGWFVKVRSGTDDLAIAPSRHPLRRKAITIMGRDANGERVSSVVQPFSRNRGNKPIWTDPVVASYNEADSRTYQPVGLLDYFFDSTSDRR